eukprot:TRINITY_DN17654_c0_g1_i9.p1 TRINITY_DN17654_c0_g1~~TRINITY_DN17654_c0_g1_i9.p1  ORF type:complete len:234 (-),score=22.32 TRINITY_DN17654_c0_g1_i9:168-869(-)
MEPYNKDLLKAIPEFKDKDNIKEWVLRVDKIAAAAGLPYKLKDTLVGDNIIYTACLNKLTGEAKKIADKDFSWIKLKDCLVGDLGIDADDIALEAYVREMERLGNLSEIPENIIIRLIKIQLKNTEFGKQIRREILEKRVTNINNIITMIRNRGDETSSINAIQRSKFCQFCKKNGHVVDECWSKHPRNQQHSNRRGRGRYRGRNQRRGANSRRVTNNLEDDYPKEEITQVGE